MPAPLKLLFVCSRNQWRSPTAEALFRRRQGVVARSRGTSARARRRVTAGDLRWADLVLVMEREHRSRLRREHPTELARATVHVLDIPDDYGYMDPELIELIEASVAPLLGL